MMCSQGSLNAVKMLGSRYNLFPKYASDLHALRSLISLCFGRASPECRRASLLAIHVPRGMACIAPHRRPMYRMQLLNH
jgi:hypothetical protein